MMDEVFDDFGGSDSSDPDFGSSLCYGYGVDDTGEDDTEEDDPPAPPT